MLVVIDTSIWRSQLALNSPSGSALRFFLNQQAATLVVPEIVRWETEHVLKHALLEWTAAIKNGHRQLLHVFGRLNNLALPSESDIEKKVESIFADTGVPIRTIPFTEDIAKRALRRVIEVRPPSYIGRQEYKDCVIWEHCLDLLVEGDVFLLTDDGGFFKDSKKKEKDKLPQVMAHECSQHQHYLSVSSDLTECLQKIQTEVSVDCSVFLKAHLSDDVRETINRLLGKYSMAISGDPAVEFKLFFTENPSELYVTFDISYSCENLTGEDRKFPRLVLRGTGMYETATRKLRDVHRVEEILTFVDSSGAELKHATVNIYAGLGDRFVKHTIREPLEYSE